MPRRDQSKLAGNAVTPSVPEWLLGRIAQALEAAWRADLGPARHVPAAAAVGLLRLADASADAFDVADRAFNCQAYVGLSSGIHARRQRLLRLAGGSRPASVVERPQPISAPAEDPADQGHDYRSH